MLGTVWSLQLRGNTSSILMKEDVSHRPALTDCSLLMLLGLVSEGAAS